jgi:uncharacterized membrane protein
MQCPRCGKWASVAHPACPQCGLDWTTLQLVNELKFVFLKTQEDCEGICNRLRALKHTLNDLEQRLASAQGGPDATAPASAGEAAEPGHAVRADFAVPPSAAPPGPARVEPSLAPPAPRREPSVGLGLELVDVPPVRPAPPGIAASRAPRPERPAPSSAEVRLGQKWLLIVGIVVVVLGVGYFLKYSFDQNWIGPAGRVAMAYLGGLACLAAGEIFRRRRLEMFGLYLIGGGIATLYFACFAAFQVYHLLPQVPAFGLMMLVTAVAGALALFYDTKWLAVLGIIGGFLTPVVLSTGVDNQFALMSYVTILNGGILSIAFLKRWSLLSHLGFAFTWLLFAGWYLRFYADAKFWTTTAFLNIYFLIYAIIPFAYYYVQLNARDVGGFAITLPNSFIALGFSFAMIRAHFSVQAVSVVTVAYAAIFLGMASILYRRNRENVEAFVLLLAKGILFLIITVPMLFSRHWITFFWSVEGAALLWAALRIGDPRLRGGALALLLVAAAKLLFYDYFAAFHLQTPAVRYDPSFTTLALERWIVMAVVLAALFRSAQMIRAMGRRATRWAEDEGGLLYGVFAVLLFVVLTVEVAACIYDLLRQARPASISVLWGLYSVGLIVLGFRYDRPVLRRCAIGLFAVVVLKVFLQDMAHVSTPYRILSFLAVGTMLIGASFLYHRYKDRILAVAREETSP